MGLPYLPATRRWCNPPPCSIEIYASQTTSADATVHLEPSNV